MNFIQKILFNYPIVKCCDEFCCENDTILLDHIYCPFYENNFKCQKDKKAVKIYWIYVVDDYCYVYDDKDKDLKIKKYLFDKNIALLNINHKNPFDRFICRKNLEGKIKVIDKGSVEILGDKFL